MTDERYRGITGLLRPYKEYVQDIGIHNGDQIVYYGCVGTCTPFVELLAVAVRGLHADQVFVPLLDETKAQKIVSIEDIGMQVSGGPVSLRPKLLVIMGGLAMPYMPVTKEQVRDLAACHTGAKLAGVCFMSMFEKAGWLDTVDFDLLIDANLDPVIVKKRDPGTGC
ncbi:DUF2124 domain-containing protein [Methanoregula sp.]|jgi:hypothetical protein|uniref:DUF2124 domain-containing protein n=1 Tax=Methanoregula sp. TaxID=2052170 RepID=UPI003C16E572